MHQCNNIVVTVLPQIMASLIYVNAMSRLVAGIKHLVTNLSIRIVLHLPVVAIRIYR